MAKVLVVDDSEMQRNNIRDIIVQRGHEVITAANGQEGIEKYQANTINLVLADHNMPILTGLEMCKEIHSIANGSPPPIIMITTEVGDEEIKAQAKQYGVKAWLVKPYKNEAIDLILKKLLASQ
ncbi:response regulator [Pseudobacteriovorax antillogorgiicola]|uniref:Two-component system, chemotaxis family, response regulator CheY n=1 Tax=Pseudobacteriovorax antillogorgiicola TaxID=1513793 RepID=A0A1Y6BS38_9BACT|nr:response regulator [Pseudobacteriovorax antillogorgiicola]TCS53147.1 two-component system chemotaxis response regulator CheY [Pseudobacteriovorax antillogorgiicola]SMF25202.1 two-component system, chemotaxis family, response regulator CheY [Pseudobacteriovorax antillogorgiicola]